MRRLLELKLKIYARWVLKKYQPRIIGITGSVGKTSAKEAIAWVLGRKFAVRASQKNYNNEIGLPLTILGLESAGHSLFGWLGIFFKAWRLLLFRDKTYPSFLILEMGVDRPGDMDYLLSIVSPDVGVATTIGQAHLEYFGSVDKIRQEKQKLIERIPSQGLAILNYDNEITRAMAEISRAKVLTYGFEAGADLRAQDLRHNNFKLNYQGSIVPVFLQRPVNQPLAYALLAGVAVGLDCELNLLEIAQGLADFSLLPGRLNFLPGYNYSTLIDDTYNASPDSVLAALKVLQETPAERRYFVLGDMLELGSESEAGHRQVGEAAAKAGIDFLLVVGPQAALSAQAAIDQGLAANQVSYFTDALAAGRFLKEHLKSGDLALIKGSQGMRLEKAVKEAMAEPSRAKELLVRQGQEWENK